MPAIKIKVRDKCAEGEGVVICNNSDYTVVWDLDVEWTPYGTKTMRVNLADGTYQDVVFTGNTAALPVLTVSGWVSVGLYAGDLHTSRAARLLALSSVLTPGGSPAAPAEDVYAQIMAKLNELSTVSPEDIAKAVEDYLAAHPIEETDPTVPEWAKAKTKPTYSAAEVGAISQSDLQAATDAALAQAKASGEFDGPRGPAGAPGKDGAGMDITGATVGQIAKITAVDASGVPTAWSPVDMPEKLPNPNALTFTGAVTGRYDGSAPLSVEIPDGGSGGYNLPVASATQLGGVMPVAKTDEMTQAVGVDEAGGLWALPGGASRSWRLVGTVDFAELYNQGVTSFEYALSSPDAIYLHQENITNDHDKTDSRIQLQYDGITLGEGAIPTRNKNATKNSVDNLCWYFDGAFAKGEKSSTAINKNYSFSTLNAMYALFQPYDGYPKTIRGVWSNTPGSFTTLISGTLEIWARELI